jgi:hypothetical protein
MAHRDSVKSGNPKMQSEDAFSGWLELGRSYRQISYENYTMCKESQKIM